MEYIYLVELRTWSSSRIVSAHYKEEDANKKADHLEATKVYSDGYRTYYVNKIKIS